MEKEDHFIFNYEYLLKSNEVKRIYHMEKEGFVRSMDLIKSKGLKIAQLVTDRDAQIDQWNASFRIYEKACSSIKLLE